jgi:serine/threonine-protein kinase
MDEVEDIGGLRRRSATGRIVAISAITSAIVSVAVVAGLARYPIPAITGAPASVEPTAADGEDDEVVVPDFSGLSVEAATRMAEAVGLGAETAEERGDDAVPAGHIVSQSHQTGSTVAGGTTVRMIVSTGPSQAAVPVLAGKTLDEARAALQAANLTAGEITSGGDGPAGTVTATSPAPGTVMAPGAAVALTVAADGVEVPRLTIMHVRRARARIQEAGLTIGRQRERFDPDHGPYIVLSQEPAAGETVPRGTEVTLVVNQGP